MSGEAFLTSLGLATPEASLTQQNASAHAEAIMAAADLDRGRAIRALYRRSGVERRGSVLLTNGDSLESYFPAERGGGPTTGDRITRYRAHAGRLAERAATAAISGAAIDPGSITHIVTASCTGFDAPGVDHHVIASLGLSADVRRTHIGFMGCHAAINALAVASAFARENEHHRVLVCCVELCSLHFSYDSDPEASVANALFADGAAAAVVASQRVAPMNPRIAGFSSTVLPDSADLMKWSIGDHGFVMRLSPSVPDRLAERVPHWVDRFLSGHDLDAGEVRSWAVHPGGPRVLTAVSDAMGLSSDASQASREVLARHGNMSSATVLFIIEKMLRTRTDQRLPLVAMAFGPGLSGEAMLLT